MRTRAAVGGVLASFAVLVVGWQAGASALSATSTTATSPGGSTATTGGSTTTPGASTPATGATDGKFTGTTVSTQFGNVQVQVTVSGGTITDVQALQLTNYGGRSVQISNFAAPILRDEVLSAQSTNVANVGGATYTTYGYLQSVQSALDQAGI
ncbi:MAG: FMN-binding protein [Pseudolysinimonas sp.]